MLRPLMKLYLIQQIPQTKTPRTAYQIGRSATTKCFMEFILSMGKYLNELTNRDSIRVFFTIQQVGLDFFITLY
jgi:hypothetical protein